jgi:hypothetical protein
MIENRNMGNEDINRIVKKIIPSNPLNSAVLKRREEMIEIGENRNMGIEDINRIQRDFLEMLRVTYKAGLIHDDLHGENLGIKLENGRYSKALFIDFGEGFYRTLDSNNAREEYLKKAESLSDLEHDMILTFNNLRSKIENKKIDTLLSPGTPVKRYRSPPKIDKRKKRELSTPIKSTKKKLFSFDSDDDF